jgi:hypothetical protein
MKYERPPRIAAPSVKRKKAKEAKTKPKVAAVIPPRDRDAAAKQKVFFFSFFYCYCCCFHQSVFFFFVQALEEEAERLRLEHEAKLAEIRRVEMEEALAAEKKRRAKEEEARKAKGAVVEVCFLFFFLISFHLSLLLPCTRRIMSPKIII